jgi:hypothetical protein
MVRPCMLPAEAFDDPERRNDLPWLEGTLLGAMRTWVLGRKRGVPADGAIRTIFANLRALEASEHLGHFMTTLSQGCTRMIHVHCTCEPIVSADEALLLDIFAMVQEERADSATDLLMTFVTPEAAYAASAVALAIVRLLNAADNTIGRGPDAMRRHAADLDYAPAGVRLH